MPTSAIEETLTVSKKADMFEDKNDNFCLLSLVKPLPLVPKKNIKNIIYDVCSIYFTVIGSLQLRKFRKCIISNTSRMLTDCVSG